MSEDLMLISGTKSEQYESLLPQVKAVIEGESDFNANMANICACFKQQFDWLWVGFYVVKGNELVVGPYQGPLACTRIRKGKGVCGTSWEKKQTIVVPDVNAFPGHIACSSLSRSEIVVPLLRDGEVVAVFDADSEYPDHFDATDKKYLEELLAVMGARRT
jgi:GAF domain-containing protein